jgi:hypothetical protein
MEKPAIQENRKRIKKRKKKGKKREASVKGEALRELSGFPLMGSNYLSVSCSRVADGVMPNDRDKRQKV